MRALAWALLKVASQQPIPIGYPLATIKIQQLPIRIQRLPIRMLLKVGAEKLGACRLGHSSVVEHLSSMYEALGTAPQLQSRPTTY